MPRADLRGSETVSVTKTTASAGCVREWRPWAGRWSGGNSAGPASAGGSPCDDLVAMLA
jgi:hypothetical protein